MAKSTQPSMETATWQGQDNCDEMKLTGSAGVLVGMGAIQCEFTGSSETGAASGVQGVT